MIMTRKEANMRYISQLEWSSLLRLDRQDGDEAFTSDLSAPVLQHEVIGVGDVGGGEGGGGAGGRQPQLFLLCQWWQRPVFCQPTSQCPDSHQSHPRSGQHLGIMEALHVISLSKSLTPAPFSDWRNPFPHLLWTSPDLYWGILNEGLP